MNELDRYRIATHLNRAGLQSEALDDNQIRAQYLQRKYGNIVEKIDAAPDVYRALFSAPVLFVFKRVQEFLWTVTKTAARLSSLARTASRTSGEGSEAPSPSTSEDGLAAQGGFRETSSRAPAVWLDMTSVHRGLTGGGIKRVCDCLSCEPDIEPAVRTLVQEGGRLRVVVDKAVKEDAVVERDDVYVVFDAFWDPFENYVSMLRAAKQVGARTAVCVYDVIPLMYPSLVDGNYARDYRSRLQAILPLVDFVLTISKSSAAEVETELRRLGFMPPVIAFALGASAHGSAPGDRVAAGRGTRPPLFTSLGTIEPKKGYECTLDAFEMLWADGIDVHFQIIGRPGWLCAQLIERIRRHPDFDKRLFWLDNASDRDVMGALAHTYCFIQASLTEGFGLPIIEAASHGLPIIASDIPVFREVGGRNVVYFPVCDALRLSQAIKSALDDRPDPASISPFTWADSKRSLAEAIRSVGSRPSAGESDPRDW